jgi:hypothetical protein
MNSLKINFKSVIIACAAFFLSTTFCFAQYPMYVTHRIESEILKDEIKKLDTKSPNYKTKLAELQKKEVVFTSKAVALEGAILKAFEAEKNQPKASSVKVNFNGISIDMQNQFGIATGGPRTPPGGTPCQGGKCQEFFLLAERCDWANAKAVRQLTINGTKFQLYLIGGFASKLTTEKHVINANAVFAFSRL